MTPGAKNKFGAIVVDPATPWSKFGAPMVEPEPFRKQIIVLKKVLEIVGTFRQLLQ